MNKRRVVLKRNIINSMNNASPSSSESTSAEQQDSDLDSYHDQLCVMFLQESSNAYTSNDYLSGVNLDSSSNDNHDNTNQSSTSSIPIDKECRIKMAQWCFQVIDYAKYKRSTVSMAISLLDRFLSLHKTSTRAHQAIQCRKMYQLASMTTLFMAIKMNETSDINGNIFCELSRHAYDVKDILEMEMTILKVLSWKIHAPLALDFMKYFLTLVPCLRHQQIIQQQMLKRRRRRSIGSSVERKQGDGSPLTSFAEILDLCGYQIDLAVGEYDLVTSKESTMAIAALFNAFESESTRNATFIMDDGKKLSIADFLSVLKKELYDIVKINIYSNEIEVTKRQLLYLLNDNNDRATTKKVKESQQKRVKISNNGTQTTPSSVTMENKTSFKTKLGSSDGFSLSEIRHQSPNCISSSTISRMEPQSKPTSDASANIRHVVSESTTTRSLFDRTSLFFRQVSKSFGN